MILLKIYSILIMSVLEIGGIIKYYKTGEKDYFIISLLFLTVFIYIIIK